MTPHVRSRARELARAATLLEAAERLALHAASGQAAIARERLAARFFGLQARQEAFHARVFAATAAFLAPGPVVAHPGGAALAAYRARLDGDLDAGDLWSSVVGVQVALEALGAAVLGEVEERLAQHLPALAPLHRVLARQEAAHHAFGVGRVRQALDSGELPAARLRTAAGDYRTLAGGLLGACAEMLDGLGESPAPYAARFEALMPTWFNEAA
jgi:hypothetical protein